MSDETVETVALPEFIERCKALIAELGDLIDRVSEDDAENGIADAIVSALLRYHIDPTVLKDSHG